MIDVGEREESKTISAVRMLGVGGTFCTCIMEKGARTSLEFATNVIGHTVQDGEHIILGCPSQDLINLRTQSQHPFSSAPPSSASRLRGLTTQAVVLGLAKVFALPALPVPPPTQAAAGATAAGVPAAKARGVPATPTKRKRISQEPLPAQHQHYPPSAAGAAAPVQDMHAGAFGGAKKHGQTADQESRV
eukprot:1148981-Pelagomonas_calceolata.AAC.1